MNPADFELLYSGNKMKTTEWIELINPYIIEDVNAGLKIVDTTINWTNYTALYVAASRPEDDNSVEFVKELIARGADVNSLSPDGDKPLHEACLKGNFKIAEILLKSGANIDAEMFHPIDLRIKGFWGWDNDFGDGMTLLIYAVIGNNCKLLSFLTKFSPNIDIRGHKNRTLLMYAVQKGNTKILSIIADYIKDKKDFINARDDDGGHVIHYFFFFERYRFYNDEQTDFKSILDILIDDLEIDVNSMINDHEETLLLNGAAFLFIPWILEKLLDFEIPFIDKSRPLLNIMRKTETDSVEDVPRRNECIKIILKAMTLRRKFGIFVPEEEIRLMDHLIGTNRFINRIVINYQNYIGEELKNLIIKYGDEEITIYDLGNKVFDNKKLKKLVKNDQLVEAFRDFSAGLETEDEKILKLIQEVMYNKIDDFHTREKLLSRFFQIPRLELLKTMYHLPYEIILMITEYLNNDDFENFIDSFYSNYDSFKSFF